MARKARETCTFEICREICAKALPRYYAFATLPAPYDHIHVNFQRNAFEIIELSDKQITLPLTQPVVLAKELGGIQRVMLVHAKSDLVGTIYREILHLIAAFRQLKNIYSDPRWAIHGVSTTNYLKARKYKYPRRGYRKSWSDPYISW